MRPNHEVSDGFTFFGRYRVRRTPDLEEWKAAVKMTSDGPAGGLFFVHEELEREGPVS